MNGLEAQALRHDHVFLGSTHDSNARRTRWVVALTAVVVAGEIAAGYLTGSMALLADGLHMATMVAVLGLVVNIVSAALLSGVSLAMNTIITKGTATIICVPLTSTSSRTR